MSPTGIADVDAKGKRTLRCLIRTLNQGCDRQNRSRADKDWQGREFGVYPSGQWHETVRAGRSVRVWSDRYGLQNRLPRPIVVEPDNPHLIPEAIRTFGYSEISSVISQGDYGSEALFVPNNFF